MISLHLEAATPQELHDHMRAFLAGSTVGVVAGPATPNTGSGEVSGTPKRLTAAERKAAEKAEAEAKAAAEAAAKAATPEGKAADQQDAKDETADQPPPVTLTQDSVRGLLGLYVQAYGMAAAQEDGPKIIGYAKISELPNDQKAFAKAVLAIAEAVEKNPHKRDLAGDGIDKAKVAEVTPIVNAAKAVK